MTYVSIPGHLCDTLQLSMTMASLLDEVIAQDERAQTVYVTLGRLKAMYYRGACDATVEIEMTPRAVAHLKSFALSREALPWMQLYDTLTIATEIEAITNEAPHDERPSNTVREDRNRLSNLY